MSKTIADYTAAVSIDAANDFLLIEPSGNTVYKKISRNVFLGLSSAPIGTTDSQSPTNKTFDNTNIFTIRDDRLTLQDDADTTKQAKFQLSGITTGTTRTYTLPNASDTLAGIAATQTFTNKTITSPAITGGTIDNSTITVDSIAGHTSSTLVTVANLQISNGVLNSANAVTSVSIAAGAIQPQALVAGTGSGWSWQSWTPVWTNVTIGNATVSCKYIQIGKTVIARMSIVWGSTTTSSGAISFTLPVTAVAYPGTANVTYLGYGTMYDVSAAVVYDTNVIWLSATTASLIAKAANGTWVTNSGANNTTPATWLNPDEWAWTLVYEAV